MWGGAIIIADKSRKFDWHYWEWAELSRNIKLTQIIATPDECEARDQENSNECGECGQEWDGDGDCPVCKNGEKVGTMQEEFDKLGEAIDNKKIEELEIQVNNLVEQRDNALVMKNEMEELRQALAKSEERVKKLEKMNYISNENLPELVIENGLMRKLLIIKLGE